MLHLYTASLRSLKLKRPFDDQSQIRIRLESEAKLYVQEKIKEGAIELIWSYILDFGNEQNPFDERKRVIKKWRAFAKVDIEQNEQVLKAAKSLAAMGLKAKDALHIAWAIEGRADFFLTTDDKILCKLTDIKDIEAINPIDVIKTLDKK